MLGDVCFLFVCYAHRMDLTGDQTIFPWESLPLEEPLLKKTCNNLDAGN